MAELSKKYRAGGDVATVAVSLDSEKAALTGYAQRLGPEWAVFCDYKGWETRPAKDYGVKGVPSTIILDARGRIRLGDSLEYRSQEMVEDLRLEAFWAKKRGGAATPDPAKPPEPAAAAPAAVIPWIFQLKSGGKLKVVSYEEKDGKYLLKLAVGSTSVPIDDVEKIIPNDPKGK